MNGNNPFRSKSFSEVKNRPLKFWVGGCLEYQVSGNDGIDGGEKLQPTIA